MARVERGKKKSKVGEYEEKDEKKEWEIKRSGGGVLVTAWPQLESA